MTRAPEAPVLLNGLSYGRSEIIGMLDVRRDGELLGVTLPGHGEVHEEAIAEPVKVCQGATEAIGALRVIRQPDFGSSRQQHP